jgi:LmbE family N-acetylglucosaminyl deacetylase
LMPAVVVAPHPDDEVLGCSSVIQDAAVTVVHVTDGVPPWTPAPARAELAGQRRRECAAAWTSLSGRVDCRRLGFGDLEAWQSVGNIAQSLAAVVASLPSGDIFLPAYQRGHPDHDATYLAGALARERLTASPGRRWWVYGLYGFDHARRLRFGWLPDDAYRPVDVRGEEPDRMRAKGNALRQFTSQVWPGSALDLWIQAPVPEHFAPLPVDWGRLPDLPCYYDEELGFGRHGASAEAVEMAFGPVLATRTG